MESNSLLIPKINPDKPTEEVGASLKKNLPNKKIFIPVLILLFVIVSYLVPAVVFGSVLLKEYKKISPVVEEIKSEDINKLQSDIALVKESVLKIKKTYKFISWMRITPFVGKYVADLGYALEGSQHLFEAFDMGMSVLSPYLSILGFTNEENAVSTSGQTGEMTAQERIDFIVSAIPQIVPKTGEISDKLKLAQEQFENINPNDYPPEFRGLVLKDNIKKGLDGFSMVSKYVSKAKPLLEVAPYLLGIDSERRYLVLFQNDKELRPTGGFMTAYSIMSVEDAKFEPVTSADIYHLDAVYKPSILAPQPIIDLIKGPYVLSQNIRLRDINYSPDFGVAMELFTEESKKTKIEDTDGIIAVDTMLLVNLLNAIGEIGVPGFGNFSTKIEPKCNCPQVIYELESFADTEGPIVWDPVSGKIVYTPPNYDNRKKIIGPLMNSILANALAQPKEKLPDLFEAIFNSMIEKHVLFYLNDQDAQKAVSEFGIGGTIMDYTGDYLHINDSNLGGRKSNMYVTQEVVQDISVDKDGVIEKTLTITYKNPEKHDGWLNSVLPNWVRVYVPAGSQLVDVSGLEKQSEISEELGKTVFSGYFKLRPEGVSKITFIYKLPFKAVGDYKILIQKQPGTDKPLYLISTKKAEEEFLLNTDKEIRVKI